MSQNDDRIAQFQNMVQADPENELGHFSLGKALLDAGRYAEAAREFRRTLELNATMSKAYQLLGVALRESGDTEGAVAALQSGHEIATQRGDNMPRDEMALLLRELGVTVQSAPAAEAVSPATESGFRCQRCMQPNPQLPKPPTNDAIGQEIYHKICHSCWREWLGYGIKVINELRLNLADPAAQAEYDRHMKEFLNL